MQQAIPHIGLFYEINNAIDPIATILEPLYAYLYNLNTKSVKKDLLKPSGFYFLLDNTWSPQTAFNAVLELHKHVCCLLVILSEIGRHENDFLDFPNVKALVSTSRALKQNICDISTLIMKIKDGSTITYSKSACKKLFLYTESVRALIEEFGSLKSLLLEETMNKKNLLLTKEPLDLKGDLE